MHQRCTLRLLFLMASTRSSSLFPRFSAWTWLPDTPGTAKYRKENPTFPTQVCTQWSAGRRHVAGKVISPGTLQGDFKEYPLVNIQKAIENGHRNSGFTHEKWWFSIAMLNYQRVHLTYPTTLVFVTSQVNKAQYGNAHHTSSTNHPSPASRLPWCSTAPWRGQSFFFPLPWRPNNGSPEYDRILILRIPAVI